MLLFVVAQFVLAVGGALVLLYTIVRVIQFVETGSRDSAWPEVSINE